MAIRFKQAHRGNYTPRQGRARAIRYIVVHYTANSGDTAQNNLDYFARKVTGTSAHYFVDETSVRQSVLDTDVAWHCGADRYRHPECRNGNSIGVEMCDSAGAVPAATKARTAAFVRELMERYGVPRENVLRHYDVTGKRCPAPWVDKPGEWTEFKDMLEDYDDMLTQEQFNVMLEVALKQRAENPATMPELLEEAKALGLTDGTRPMALMTREEGAVMARAAVKVAQKSRS